MNGWIVALLLLVAVGAGAATGYAINMEVRDRADSTVQAPSAASVEVVVRRLKFRAAPKVTSDIPTRQPGIVSIPSEGDKTLYTPVVPVVDAGATLAAVR